MFVIVAFGITLLVVSAMTGAVQMATVADVRLEHRMYAEDAAENAITEALARIRSGEIGLLSEVTYEDEFNHSKGSITFDTRGAAYATNNLESSSSISGWNGRLVPPRCIHLVAIGEAGGQRRVRELMVMQNGFPWSVASNGKVEGKDIQVYAVEDLEAAAAGSDQERLKSDILSNGEGDAIVLTGNSEVEGSAKAVGDVLVLDGAVVKGDQLRGQAFTELDIRKTAADYDPDAERKPSLVYGPGVDKIQGRYVARGNVFVGDLELEDGLLFVRGSITVTGKVKGKGAIVATDDITINGSMNTRADLAALVAGGDIKIRGIGANSSSFQGLILAEGSFSAKDTRLVGTVISKDREGKVELERVTMVRPRDLTSVEVNFDKILKESLESLRGGRVGNESGTIGVLYKRDTQDPGTFIEYKTENYDALKALAQRIKTEGGTFEYGRQTSDGFVTTAPEREPLRGDFLDARNSWNTYVGQVETNTVETEEIFQLDFNEFLKAKGSLRPLYQKTSAL